MYNLLPHLTNGKNTMCYNWMSDSATTIRYHEALACGIPVAAYPVSGPIDIIENGVNGSLNHDLETAIKDALKISKEECIKKAKQYTWQSSTNQFESSLTPIKIL